MNYRYAFNEIKQNKLPNISYMIKRIWQFASEHTKEYKASRIRIFADFILCTLMYGCDSYEYENYGFFFLRRKEKKKIATEIYEEQFEKAHTDEKQKAIVDNKEESLVQFSDYVKRDWCGIKYHNEKELYDAFFNAHEVAIFKPVNGQMGKGIHVEKLSGFLRDGTELRDYCIHNNVIVEELIVQHDKLNTLYPNAVNTVRIVTMQGKCIAAALRMGVGDACVDNAHAGGVFAEINIDKGVIDGSALRCGHERYECHPTTGTGIPGFEIPYWEECRQLCENASKLVPDIYLLGWDIAVTPDGPTVVEVNTTPGLMIIQAPNCHGIKHEFEKIKD